MVKTGYKHKTSYFGDAGELYCASLFQMAKIDNGSRRPDLITSEGLSKALSIEVKSSRPSNMPVHIGSLFYAMLPLNDVGETNTLTRQEFQEAIRAYDPKTTRTDEINRVYFNFNSRVDGLKARDLQHPFSGLRFQYGDQFLVPARYVVSEFASLDFLLEKERAEMKSVSDSLDYVRESILDHALKPEEEGSKNRRDWRRFNRLTFAQFVPELELNPNKDAIERAKKRADTLRRVFPGVDNLLKGRIEGPNGTSIYYLAEREDQEVIERMSRVIEERKKALEKIIEERKKAEELLEKAKISWQPTFEDSPEKIPEKGFSYDLGNSYTPRQIGKMVRLCSFLMPGERLITHGIEKSYEIVDPEEQALREEELFSDAVPF